MQARILPRPILFEPAHQEISFNFGSFFKGPHSKSQLSAKVLGAESVFCGSLTRVEPGSHLRGSWRVSTASRGRSASSEAE